MRYAPEAHHPLDNRCLPGTRMEIIEAILQWAVGADVPISTTNQLMLPYNESSRVLWICGTAGSGKTSILRSCAANIKTMSRGGVYYGFDKNKPAVSISALFSTISRDLAGLDSTWGHQLVEVIQSDNAKRTTVDCNLQFEYHIVAPAKGVVSIGETVIFIDAFDESGSRDDRGALLHILTQRASELPAGLRIVITSRYESDVREALLKHPHGVDIIMMENVARDLTSRDIGKYVRSSLKDIEQFKEERYRADLDSLVAKAETSFQWAATACRFIDSKDTAGVDPGEQLQTVLQSNQGLDELYTAIMDQFFPRSNESALKRLKSVLGRIISAREPLTLTALARLSRDSTDLTTHRGIVKFLGSLLSGTHDDNTPIAPLHASFREFLHNSARSGEFFVDEKEAHASMARECMQVMKTDLRFNICCIPTSFLPNCKIPNIEGLVQEHISLPLLYASRNWAFHIAEIPTIAVPVDSLHFFFREKFLNWLEVMSLTQTDSHSVLTALTNIEVSNPLQRKERFSLIKSPASDLYRPLRT